jgi:hypothetical protein
MNGSGTAVICLFNALEARRRDAGMGQLSSPDQAPGGLDDLLKAAGKLEIAERVRCHPPDIVEFVVQERLAGTPARGEDMIR